MYILFECAAEAVMEKGLRGLAEMVPGGGAMFDVAKLTWEKYRERCKDAKQRAEIQQLAVASFAQAEQAAVEAAQKAAANQPDLQPVLQAFLAQIPASIRQSLKRADDPTGTTIPATFALRGPEDIAKLLPPALPRFKAGDPLPGRPGWRLERQLGIGGFGEVWLTRHPQYQSLQRAVKFCRNLDTRDRDLLQESAVIDKLLQHGPHDNIVKLEDVNLEGEAPWLMYEYVEGGDLTDLIHEWSALPPTERQQKALAALKELAETVAHFHRLGIVHRDLKPADILRDKKGRLRITDFGISGIAAKHMIESETRGQTTLAGRGRLTHVGGYTPIYASPQQKDGGPPDPRDDVHALGVIAYQMLTGQVAQGVGSDFAQDLKDVGLSESYADLLCRCTSAKSQRRPADGVHLTNALAERSRQSEIQNLLVREWSAGENDTVEFTSHGKVIRVRPGSFWETWQFFSEPLVTQFSYEVASDGELKSDPVNGLKLVKVSSVQMVLSWNGVDSYYVPVSKCGFWHRFWSVVLGLLGFLMAVSVCVGLPVLVIKALQQALASP